MRDKKRERKINKVRESERERKLEKVYRGRGKEKYIYGQSPTFFIAHKNNFLVT